MGDLGWFEGQRAELVDGEIVVLSPQNFPHSSTTVRVFEALRSAFGSDFWVRMQLPLDTGRTSLPEPDVSVVAGHLEDYTEHPSEALLIVEVSDTTLTFDRGRKAANYAAAGVQDYWIVNLVDRRLEVHRDPRSDDADPQRWRYQTVRTLTTAESISPLALPAAAIAVQSLLPPP